MSSDKKLHAISILLISSFVSACSSLYIGPPGPDRQTLLVLPIEIKNISRTSYRYNYAYEIQRVDGSTPPYEAVFDLPVNGDLLIIDSLPPGEYFVEKLVMTSLDPKGSSFGTATALRHDRFRLEPGSITIFPHSLDVHIERTEQVSNSDPRYTRISTSYKPGMSPISPALKKEIMATLEELENFEQWTISDISESNTANLEQRLLDDGYQLLESWETEFIFKGNTLLGTTDSDTTAIYLDSGGRMGARSGLSSGANRWDRGSWNTKDDIFCISWDRWEPSTECRRVYSLGRIIVLIDPSRNKTVYGKIYPRNPFDLSYE